MELTSDVTAWRPHHQSEADTTVAERASCLPQRMRLLERGAVEGEAILMQGRESLLPGVERAFLEVLGDKFSTWQCRAVAAKLD